MVLDGKVSGLGLDNDPAKGSFVNNLPLAGATRRGLRHRPRHRRAPGRRPLHRKTVGADGRWGPFTADGRTAPTSS